MDAENYLLACYRYIELNPLRAQMVEHPAEYRWPSYSVNAGFRSRRRLIAHYVYQRLGYSRFQKQVEQALGRKIGYAKQGRPCRDNENGS